MKITIDGLGLFAIYSGAKSKILEIEDDSTVKVALEKLKLLWGEEFYKMVITDDGKLSPHVIILLNGLSITMKNGLDTQLSDGDRLVFAIMVNGG